MNIPPTRQLRRRRFVFWGAIGGLFSLGVLCVWLAWPPEAESSHADFVQRFRGGALIIAGGGALPPIIRQTFLDLAGGPAAAKLVVIPAFSLEPSETERLLQPWRTSNVCSIQILHTTDRLEADDASFAELLDDATGVWLSGGDQGWLSKIYAGTLVEAKLKSLLQRGGVIGGSSAGAAAMTQIMIEQGLEAPVEGLGFDLLPGAIVDQHFLRRSRLNRLMRLMESHPKLIAFGIDEGTALVVHVASGKLGILGNSYVVAYVPETHDGQPRFEVMKQSDQIDIRGLASGRVRISSPSDLDAILSDTSP